MDEIVNILTRLNSDTEGSGVSFICDEGTDRLDITALPGRTTSLRLTQLYRPSSEDVVRNAAPDTVLVLIAASAKAAQAAAPYNHIVLPNGSFRIVGPGIALIRAAANATGQPQARQVRLMGRTGVIAESLLLGGNRPWSVRELADVSQVSPALAQRAIQRLESEGLLESAGAGRDKTRTVTNPRALAELWSREEREGRPVLRGFLYRATPEEIVRAILECYPDGAVGSAFAANLFAPTLTRITPPFRVWAPHTFDRRILDANGFQETAEGTNLELTAFDHDSWQIHREREGIPRVSRWRAWIEISQAKGRIQELAEALLKRLEDEWHGHV